MAQVVVELSGDEAKLLKSYQKIRDGQDKMDEGLKKVKASTKEVGAAHGEAAKHIDNSFGSRSVASLKAYVTGMATLTAGVNMFRSAMEESRARTEAAKASVESLIESRRRLQQVATGEGGRDTQAMNTQADALAQRAGISRAEARNVIFGARSEGYQGAEGFVARLAGANYMTAESAQRAVGQVRGIYDKKITPQQAVAGVAAGAFSSRLDVEEFMQQFPKLAGGAQAAGSSFSEALAIAGYVPTKNERANEYVATFANQFAINKEFKGLGIMGTVEKLKSMPESQRQKMMGTSKEANLAYMWLAEGGEEIKRRESAIGANISESGGLVQQIEARAFDPKTQEGRLNRARVERNKAQVSAEVSAESTLAEAGYARETAILKERQRMTERGTNFVTQWAVNRLFQLGETAELPPGALTFGARAIQTSAEQSPFGARTSMLQDRKQDVADIIQYLKEIAGNTAEAKDSQSATANQRAAAAAVAE